MKIHYSILTPSKLLIEIDNKKIIVNGEVTTTPVFYADINSFKKWESPFENILITEEEKKRIIKLIEEESKNSKVPVVFD